MFGYVRPLKGELRVRELEEYKAVYCGLCRTLGKRCGLAARFTLNYDFVFLAMLLAYEPEPCVLSRCRCPVHPFRKGCVCTAMPALDVAADESLILSWHKLQDDVADHGFWRGLPARLASVLLRPACKKAAAARPDFDRQVTQCLKELHDLETRRCPSMDAAADTFARILRAAAPDTGDEARDRATGQLLYHVGRWIYLIDAWDDLEEDRRTGAYNPIDARFEGDAAAHRQEVELTLRHSRDLAASAYELARSVRWDGILSNILYLGLPAVESLVLSGRRQKKESK